MASLVQSAKISQRHVLQVARIWLLICVLFSVYGILHLKEFAEAKTKNQSIPALQQLPP